MSWDCGPYERVGATLGDMHDHVVARLRPGPGSRWLDVATGTGEVALRAARAGAEVTGLDLAAASIETARRLADAEGLTIRFDVGNAEALPYEDASFDVVSSTVGVMFAADHRAVARELARVCRPGGRLGLTSWRPAGTAGDTLRLLAPFSPPRPPEAGNPLDWGREEHVAALLGDDFELELEERESVLAGESGEGLWELFATSFGPIRELAARLEPAAREELRRTFVELHERYRVDGGIRMPRTYLLALGTRRRATV